MNVSSLVAIIKVQGKGSVWPASKQAVQSEGMAKWQKGWGDGSLSSWERNMKFDAIKSYLQCANMSEPIFVTLRNDIEMCVPNIWNNNHLLLPFMMAIGNPSMLMLIHKIVSIIVAKLFLADDIVFPIMRELIMDDGSGVCVCVCMCFPQTPPQLPLSIDREKEIHSNELRTNKKSIKICGTPQP